VNRLDDLDLRLARIEEQLRSLADAREESEPAPRT
jgi:hypothetical protein